jgi:hypothetical protein
MKAMSNRFTITLSQPCFQGWEAMPSRAEGRYCGTCDQIVVDFTRMTDQELVDYFQSRSGRVCGRLSSWQTDRIITVAPKPNRRFTLPGIAATLLGLLLSFTGNAQNAHTVKRELPTTLTPLPTKPIAISPSTTPPLAPPMNVLLPIQGSLGGVCIQPVEVKQSWRDRVYERIEDILRYF